MSCYPSDGRCIYCGSEDINCSFNIGPDCHCHACGKEFHTSESSGNEWTRRHANLDQFDTVREEERRVARESP